MAGRKKTTIMNTRGITVLTITIIRIMTRSLMIIPTTNPGRGVSRGLACEKTQERS
jgi:hypothetical protein